eukprot:6750852-Pyramimonas_sp.AAC.1
MLSKVQQDVSSARHNPRLPNRALYVRSLRVSHVIREAQHSSWFCRIGKTTKVLTRVDIPCLLVQFPAHGGGRGGRGGGRGGRGGGRGGDQRQREITDYTFRDLNDDEIFKDMDVSSLPQLGYEWSDGDVKALKHYMEAHCTRNDVPIQTLIGPHPNLPSSEPQKFRYQLALLSRPQSRPDEPPPMDPAPVRLRTNRTTVLLAILLQMESEPALMLGPLGSAPSEWDDDTPQPTPGELMDMLRPHLVAATHTSGSPDQL